ncbi:PIN domain-containing protein [Phyllobacterium leguminum]|uniref:Putative nucleic acid-binding protein n=1 Tax=Phyllobacterium leguminum TaxID=314237 RepID=A0A318T104_9HYPH|nr:PIN domain-containing protein [Phyllobacterium leguminum]PYE87339.1 putative nucleic acid-binding protein [Phyllobacterium leguminum]
MPGAKVFIDTNVLVYSHDRKSPDKSQRALAWLESLGTRDCAQTNLQVLNELTYVLLRKKWFDSPTTVFAIVDRFAILGNDPLNPADVEFARALHLKTVYSWWDCLLLASAIDLKCRYFLSEDLHDGHAIEGLTIINPFLHTADKILAL